MDKLAISWSKTTLANLSRLPQNEAFAGAVSILLEAYTEAIRQNQAYEQTIAAQRETIKQLTAEVEAGNKFMDNILGRF